MKDVLIGIDVGTTRIKAVATDLELNYLGEVAAATPWIHDNNLSSIDFNSLAKTAILVATQVATKIGGKAKAIGITGFSETGALLGKDNEPLSVGFAWHDPRGDCEKIMSHFGVEKFQKITGAKVTPVVTITKILWQQAHIPETRQIQHYLSAPEWVAFVLGGEITNELSLVSRTGLLDINNKVPWLEGIAFINGGPDLLGRIVQAGESVGTVKDHHPENLRGATLTIAGHDHQTAAYYCGAIKKGALFDSMGTAEAILRTHFGALSQDSMNRLASNGISVGWTVIPDHQIILAGSPTGITLERIGSMLGVLDWEGRKGLGELALIQRRDHHDLKVVATYHSLNIENITDSVSPALLWRVAVEDLMKMVDRTLLVIDNEIGKHDDVFIAGGWIYNPMVNKAKQDQFGTFKTADVVEAGAMGAAEFGGVALGAIAPRW